MLHKYNGDEEKDKIHEIAMTSHIETKNQQT
jgi:hypothetical protein